MGDWAFGVRPHLLLPTKKGRPGGRPLIFPASDIRLELVLDSKLDAIDGIVNIAINGLEEYILYFVDTRYIVVKLQDPNTFLNVTGALITLDVFAVAEQQVQGILDIKENL